ncbi:MAG: hypothetical protein ACKVP7_09130 [Hyphomicrobiaceae bacterium]
MRKLVMVSVIVSGVVAAGGVGVWFLDARQARPTPQGRDLHSFLHINCKHHAHGAAWHKDHGRILGGQGR